MLTVKPKRVSAFFTVNKFKIHLHSASDATALDHQGLLTFSFRTRPAKQHENVYCLSGWYGVTEVIPRPHVLPSQIAEHSWDRLEADPAPSPFCKHKRQGRGLPPGKKNGFLKATSCGTVLRIQRGERRADRHNSDALMNRAVAFSCLECF